MNSSAANTPTQTLPSQCKIYWDISTEQDEKGNSSLFISEQEPDSTIVFESSFKNKETNVIHIQKLFLNEDMA